MSFTQGMNVDVVVAEAGKIQSQTAQLRTLKGSVDSIVKTIDDNWNGLDSQKFVNQWNGQHKTQINKIIDELEAFARKAKSEAEEQRRASA